MSDQLDPSSRAGVTLDLILKTFINSKGFTSSVYKNWEALSAMIPGTTPLQVCIIFYSFPITVTSKFVM